MISCVLTWTDWCRRTEGGRTQELRHTHSPPGAHAKYQSANRSTSRPITSESPLACYSWSACMTIATNDAHRTLPCTSSRHPLLDADCSAYPLVSFYMRTRLIRGEINAPTKLSKSMGNIRHCINTSKALLTSCVSAIMTNV